jgi:hypothetical protein
MDRRTTLRVRLQIGVAAAMAAMALPAALASGPARAEAPSSGGPAGITDAQVESYAMRLEYDIPLPVGTGTVAHVSGDARRSSGGENAKGVAASPSELDAVVGGKYIDPQGTGHPVRRLPQSECFYPGSLVDTHFAFPTDTQGETTSGPPVGYSTARCSAGPQVELHGNAQSSDAKGGPLAVASPAMTAGTVSSDAYAYPSKGTLIADTASRSSGISVLGGVMTIGSVQATGRSTTNGAPKGGATRADIAVSDINAGGVRFSLSSASVNGEERIEVTAAGQTVPVSSAAGKALIDAANAAIKPQGCTMTPLTTPDSYPQGFLFSRPNPEIGVRPDGTLAASYRGGLLVVCDMPKTLTDNFGGFSPQRAQMLFGFAYTSTAASTTNDTGGFNLGDLGGGAVLGGGGPVLSTSPSGVLGRTSASPSFSVPAPVAGGGETPAAAPSSPPTTIAPSIPHRLAAIRFPRMDGRLRWVLGLIGLVGWALLTHLGARRFLLATTDCSTVEGRPA